MRIGEYLQRITNGSAQTAWAAATSQTGQLAELSALWSGDVEIRGYSLAGTLLTTLTYSGWNTDTSLPTYFLSLDTLIDESFSVNDVVRYCKAFIPGGAEVVAWDISPVVSSDLSKIAVNGLRVNATASLPAVDYAWATGLSNDTWTAIADTQFFSWADGGGITAGAYRGTDPFANMVDAYCDMCQAPNGMIYIYGGGHGDGTCNAVVRCDPADFSYTQVGNPTPPSVYLPDYPDPLPIYYPSGLLFDGWFLSSSILTDPADSAYAAPALARVSTHMYGAAVCTGSTVHYNYLTYGKFNISAGTWGGYGVNLGTQLAAILAGYGTAPLQIYTMGLFDQTTGLIFLTLIPGTDGGGWRDGIVVLDPATDTILSVNEGGSDFGTTKDWCDIKIAGRKLYVFTNTGTGSGPFTLNQGYICDLDDLATKTGRNTLAAPTTKKFTISGDTAGGVYTSSPGKDAIPSFYDGTYIWRWNYGANLNKIYRLNLTPASGAGTVADPYVLTQTERTLSGTITGTSGSEVVYVYSRLFWVPGAGCAIVIPRASSNWYALKLS